MTKEANIQAFFESFEQLDEKRRRGGGGLIGALLKAALTPAKKPRSSGAKKPAADVPVHTTQYRDPKTGRITPQFWGNQGTPKSPSMNDIIRRKNEASGLAHHKANYSPEARAKHKENLIRSLKANPHVGEIMDIESKVKSGKYKRPSWMKESVLSNWYKAKKRKEALSAKISDDAATKSLKARTYQGVAKKAFSDDFKKTATDIAAKHGKRADQLNRRLDAVKKPKTLNYMGSK
jgi:hypothetical protein